MRVFVNVVFLFTVLVWCPDSVLAQEQANRLIKAAYDEARDNKITTATPLLYKGLVLLQQGALADSLLKDVWDIITPDELEEYQNSTHKGQVLLAVWRRRDIVPGTPENERFAEHIHRLDYARQYYSSPQPRGYDDRGMIYIRYGEPDLKSVSESPNLIRPNECWIYYKYEPDLIFNFARYGGLYSLYKDNYGFALAADASSLKAMRPRLGAQELYEEFLQDRAALHTRYSELYSILMGGSGSPSDKAIAFRTCFNTTNTEFKVALHESPITYTSMVKPGKMKVQMQAARFFRAGATLLELYLGIPFDQLADTSGQATLRFAYTVLNEKTELLDQEDNQQCIDLRQGYMGKGLSFTSQISTTLPPSSSLVALTILHNETGHLAELEMNSQGFDASNENLFLSDIQMAAQIEQAPLNSPSSQKRFIKHGYLIRPYAFKTINPERTLYLYFEAYNIMLNTRGQSKLQITWQIRAADHFLAKINPFAGKKYSLSSTFSQTGQNRVEPLFFALDFAKLMPGEYQMIITVHDEISNNTSKTLTNFEVLKS